MEYVSGGSLLNCIANGRITLTPQKVVKFAKDIASGMRHLHAENIIHLDLACRNLLVNFGENDNQTIKITDFGLSRIMESDTYKASSDATFPVRWTAPETLTMGVVSRASDVWSFAVTIWEMIERKIPYFDLPSNQIADYVSSGKRLPRPTKVDIPDELWELMKKCWEQFADQRPSFTDISAELKNMEMNFNPSGVYTRTQATNQSFFVYTPNQDKPVPTQAVPQNQPEQSGSTSHEMSYGNASVTTDTPQADYNTVQTYPTQDTPQDTYNTAQSTQQANVVISESAYGNAVQ